MLTDYLLIVVILVLRDATRLRSEEIHREDEERKTTFSKLQGYSMVNHAFKSLDVKDSVDCVFECLNVSTCQSINLQSKGNPKHLCELNNNTLASKPWCKQGRVGFDHFEPKAIQNTNNLCLNSPCKNGANCVLSCDENLYKCLCNSFNTGKNCDGWTVPVSSCKDIYDKTSHRKDMTYTFVIEANQIDIYCHMTQLTGCSAGGWTLTMKINGSKKTFKYNSVYWSNKISYNPTAGKTGFDSIETKMPSYWGVSFNTICLGFTVNGVTNFAAISYTATSLYDVIRDGNMKTIVGLGKSKWQSLITGSSLQYNCIREGFNLPHIPVRIGITANNENTCDSPDGFIGYGGNNPSTGNRCHWHCNKGEKVVPAVGYILIK